MGPVLFNLFTNDLELDVSHVVAIFAESELAEAEKETDSLMKMSSQCAAMVRKAQSIRNRK